MMEWFEIFALTALLFCTISLASHFMRILSLGMPNDLSHPTGVPGSAMGYALIGSMSPAKKESAFLHLPTYIGGLLYHVGTFLSFFLLFIFFFEILMPSWISLFITVILIFSGMSGIAILIKRIWKPQMRALSNPDDYISNVLVSLFQLMTALALLSIDFLATYFVVAGLLFFYIPVGKLKHTIYFFAARRHLAYFYGWRNIWPPK